VGPENFTEVQSPVPSHFCSYFGYFLLSCSCVIWTELPLPIKCAAVNLLSINPSSSVRPIFVVVDTMGVGTKALLGS